jgi:hypothetical protein
MGMELKTRSNDFNVYDVPKNRGGYEIISLSSLKDCTISHKKG